MGQSSGKSRTIRSVDRAFDILHVIREMEGARVSDIASEIDMAPGSVHPYLKSLEQQGYVVRQGKEYDIGLRFLSLGGYARQQRKLFQITRDLLKELAEETGTTVRLVVENNDHCITIYKVSPLDSEASGVYEGFEETMVRTAAGKSILAEYPDQRVRDVLDNQKLLERTSNTIADEEELFTELEEIESRGYAVDEECFDDAICIADSIKTPEGALLGAISMASSVSSTDREEFLDDVPKKLQNVTGVIEIDYTYSFWE